MGADILDCATTHARVGAKNLCEQTNKQTE